MTQVLDKLNWRYATKQFDSSKHVSPEDLETLLEAARLTASSYGLQPYHIIAVKDKDLRSKLRKASWDQAQITDSSYLLVLANKPTFGENLVDDYIDNLVETRGVSKQEVAGYSQMMKSSLLGLSDVQKNSWSTQQAYIVLGNLMNIAAEMKIDTCPMEGIDNSQYNDILGLADKNLNASVVLAIGYRSKEDKTQDFQKVRYSKKQLITHI